MAAKPRRVNYVRAAVLLGTSIDTVRRRVKAGEINATLERHVPAGQLWIDLGDPKNARYFRRASAVADGERAMLRGLLSDANDLIAEKNAVIAGLLRHIAAIRAALEQE